MHFLYEDVINLFNGCSESQDFKKFGIYHLEALMKDIDISIFQYFRIYIKKNIFTVKGHKKC